MCARLSFVVLNMVGYDLQQEGGGGGGGVSADMFLLIILISNLA